MMQRRNEPRTAGVKRKRGYPRRQPQRISVPRPLREQQLNFKRKFFLENWAPNNVSTNGFWRLFNLAPNLLPEWANFVSLFDVFKVTGVLLEFHPRYSEFAGNDNTSAATSNSGTRVHIVNDPFSIVGPSGIYNAATLNSMLENGNCRSYSGNRIISVYSRPTIFMDVGGATMIKRAPWLRTDSGATGHKCCHVFMQDNNFSGVFRQSFDVFATYYIRFKNLR